ncbi:MAG: molybdopterin molybdotransferase MoeA [Thermoprotei archaeon]|nr:molybdopterin molybdotransferase MoeA [Thermoprotei archaeon]
MSSTGGFKSLTSIEEVLREAGKLLTHKPSTVKVNIGEALGRYLAEDIVAPFNLPPHNRSVVDGYAVRSRDTFGASPSNPVILRVKGFIRVGENPSLEVGEGEAVELSTGAPMPKGADSVVMYEKARRVGDFIEVLEPVPPLANVSRVGEDVRGGERILVRGVRLAPWDIAVLASLGYKSVMVYSVNVALISTGSELVELESVEDARGVLEGGLVINSNRYSMEGLLRGNGFNPHYLGIVPDDFEAVRNVILEALENYDAVITMGGASVGKPDYTVKAVKSLNPEYLVHGILMRPGRANSLAIIRGKPVFMLSGFPVASIVGFEAIAKPLLLKMVGGVEEPKPVVKGVLTRRVNTPINVRSYVRVKVYRKNGEVYVEPLALTGSGILSTLVKGNGILIVPENREGYDEGDIVEVILLRSIEWGGERVEEPLRGV